MNSSAAPVLLVLSGAVILSFSSVFVKLAHVGPTVSAFYRLVWGGGILMALSIWRGDNIWSTTRAFAIMTAAGAFFAVDLFLWHRSIDIVGPGLATILGNFQVFFVGLAAVLFLGERLNWKILAAVPLGLAGLFLIVGLEWKTAPGEFKWGVWLGIFTAMAYAGYLITLRHARILDKDEISPFGSIGIISLVSGLLLGIVIIIQGQESFAIPDRQTWGALLGLAVLIQVLGWVMITRGLPEMNVSVAALLLLLQPALAFVWDMLLFRRPTTGIELIGVAVTLGAIYLGSRGTV